MSGKIAIVTDSNSGITQDMGKEWGVYVLPMPFSIDGELLFEGIDLSREEFFEKQAADADIVTSQPSPGDVLDLWDELLETYDEILHIPMTSGLSGTCETAMALSRDYNGRVVVVDNCRISVTLKQSILDAKKLIDEGKNAEEIAEILVEHKKEACIYLTVDTLKYLKKGGRVTPAAAAIGSVLNIKPVLELRDKKIDSFAKVRGWKQAKKTMFEAMKKELNENYVEQNMKLCVVHTCSPEEVDKFKNEMEAYFPEYTIEVDDLSLSIVTHVGPGVFAVACAKVL
ncbi:MAG: DegV family protein [Eubacteriales bacterium]